MATNIKNFNEVVNFTRGTGATRVNPAGLIVGVDFSSSSIVFGTGSKVFTLTADANVNRDWSIGEPVIAVSQATPLGSLTGTVTSYDPATQTLTIEVSTSTGTGTATNWRIGSLAVRRDAKGILQEPQSTAEFSNSKNLVSNGWAVIGGGSIVDNEQIVNTFGSIGASKFTEPSTNNTHFVSKNDANIDAQKTFIVHAKSNNTNRGFVVRMGRAINSWFAVNVDLNTGSFNTYTGLLNDLGVTSASVVALSNGWYEISLSSKANFNSVDFGFVETPQVILTGGGGFIAYQADGTQSVYIAQTQLQVGEYTSLIPTTTVAVTRAADVFEATAETIEAIRQGQGTIIVEAETEDNGLAQKRAVLMSGGTGSIRVAKEGGLNQGLGYYGFVEHQESIYISPQSGLLPENNGLEFVLNEYGSIRRENSPFQTTFTSFTSIKSMSSDDSKLRFVGSAFDGQTQTNAEWEIDTVERTVKGLGIGNRTFNAAHYTGLQFVLPMAFEGYVTLTNGDSYRIINDPNITQPCNDATHDPVSGRIVIVGNGGYIGTSDDGGETWTQRTAPANLNHSGVTKTTTNYVAVVSNTANTAANIIYSADAENWIQAANSNAPQILQDCHFANSLVVSVGNAGAITVSADDGVTWTAATSNTTVTLNAVTYSAEADLWVACGPSTVLTATDPTGSWTVYDNTNQPTIPAGRNFLAVDYFNGLFYIGSSNNIYLKFDPVAITFAAVASVVASTLNGVSVNSSGVLLCGTGGAIAFGDDVNGFTSQTNNNATLNGIAFGNNRFVSVGNAANGSGYIATIDPDGTVTRRVTSNTVGFSNVRFLRGEFYSLRTSPTQYRYDPVTFAEREVNIGQNAGWIDIADDGVYLITVANVGNVRYSADDVTYTSAVTGTTQNLNAVFSKNGLSVIVGNTGTILTTTDPTQPLLPQTSGTTANLRSVIYSERDERWYVAGDNGTLLYSDDNAQTFHPVQNASFAAIDNNGVQANPLAEGWIKGLNRIALSYKQDEINLAINGFVSKQDNAGSIPSINSILIGDNFNGYIKRLKYYPIAYNADNTSRMSLGLEPTFVQDELSANGTDALAVNDQEDTLGT